MLPMFKHLKGILSANVSLSGTMDNIIQSGEMDLSNAGFLFAQNNLEYNAEAHLTLDNKNITIDNFMVENTQGTKQGGRMNGRGLAVLDNFKITSLNIEANGDLKALSKESKSASPTVYGDLVIETNGSIKFTMDEKGKLLNAPITVKYANLTFAPAKSAYSGASSKYVYQYVKNPNDTINKGVDFETLVEMSHLRDERNSGGPAQPGLFDYSINVNVENEATIVFVMSKEANQNLTAILTGDFLYEKQGNKTNAQGELTLLDGSTLSFLKKLDATGTIQFINELSNPYLNIVATYAADYSGNLTASNTTASGSTTTTETTAGGETPVEVRIKINGFLNDITTGQLAQDKNNVAVYVGSENIKNNVVAQSLDVSDAIIFIMTNQFKLDNVGNGGGGNFPASLAASLSGSILSGYLNQQFGEYVKSIEVKQSGTSYKIALSGQAGNFKYTIGGATNNIQDLGQADVQIVYPIGNLQFRLERKQSVVEQQSNTTEMINELGLKYIFNF